MRRLMLAVDTVARSLRRRSHAKILATLVVVAGTLAVAGSTEQSGAYASTATPANAGPYVELRALNSGYCLDTTGTADFTGVAQTPCAATISQQWSLVFDPSGNYSNPRVVNRATGKCLTVPAASPANTVVPVLYTCQTTYWSAQFWTWITEPYTPPAQPRGHYLIADAGSKCLSVPWNLTGLTFLDQYTCAPYPNQLWNEVVVSS